MLFFIKFFEIALNLENNFRNKFIFLLLSLIVILPMTLISNFARFYKWSKFGNILSILTITIVSLYNMSKCDTVKEISIFNI